MLQLAILGNDTALQEKIKELADHGRKEDRAMAAAGTDFFSLLIKQDKLALEKHILNISVKAKTDDPKISDCMCYLGTLQTKLCWFRGIPVEIDSPLVPMELMPIQPLKHYDDVYDFLAPGWVPLRQGLLQKASRLFKS